MVYFFFSNTHTHTHTHTRARVRTQHKDMLNMKNVSFLSRYTCNVCRNISKRIFILLCYLLLSRIHFTKK